jgi:T-complex protein 1 subunit eta
MEAFVWEPALVKLNMVEAATEAACLILSVDLTVQPPSKYDPMKNALPGLN